MFEFVPDYEMTWKRMQAFWARDVLDRPLVTFPLEKPAEKRVRLPVSQHATIAERWLDPQYQAELALASFTNQEFLGDTLPITNANLGPEVFGSFYGCPLHFGDYGTSWSDPILFDWADADKIQIDWNHPYLKQMHLITEALLEIGKGKFIVGAPDWHPGGDALASFRDPQNLAMDLITNPDDVKKLLNQVTADYFKVYDQFYEQLRAAGMPCTTWTPLLSDGKYYVPSNDFSIMVSKKMFDEFFLPGLTEECRQLKNSIYHLDGPGALRHLDSLLSIPELDALQWVPGAGNENFSKWVSVYQKAQARGKSIQVISIKPSDLPLIMQTLSPKGMMLNFMECDSRETAEAVMKALEKWTAGK